MGILARMTILVKMRFGCVALVTLLVLITGLAAAAAIWISDSRSDSGRALDQTRVANQATTAIVSMGTSVVALSAAVARGYGDTEAAAGFTTNGTAAATAIEEALAGAIPGSEDAAALEQSKALLGQYREAGDALFALAKTDPVNLPAKVAPVVELGTQVQEAAVAYQESTTAQLTAKLNRLGANSTMALIVMVVLGAIGVVWGLATLLLLVRRVLRSIGEAAAGIGSSAAEVLAGVSQMAANAGQTAASTNETMATVEELKQTATLAHEKASEIAESGENVTRIAESGRTATEETMVEIEHMLRQMGAIGETITRLSEQTQAVEEVIATVNDLAEQSNLLSLNASIEAAKAGEYGIGFSVVAQEVKSLAERSKQAVKQVRTILGEIMKSAATAVCEAEKGREAMEVGRQKSHEADQAIRVLAESVVSGAKYAGEHILATSQQQSAGMDQIGQAIGSISEATSQSVSGTKQVEQGATQLQKLAVQLKRMVEIKVMG